MSGCIWLTLDEKVWISAKKRKGTQQQKTNIQKVRLYECTFLKYRLHSELEVPSEELPSAINSANVVLWSWDVLGYLHVFNVLLSVWTYVQHALAAGRACIDFVGLHYANACMHSEWLLHQYPTTQYTYSAFRKYSDPLTFYTFCYVSASF